MKVLCITITLVLALVSVSLAANCYGPSSKLSVVDFDVFPSPVAPGETVYARANVLPSSPIESALVQISVYYTTSTDVSQMTPIITMNALDFCSLSSMITCPLPAQSTILSWQFVVPDILPGTYQIRYIINDKSGDNPYSCIQFAVIVSGAPTDSFMSYYSAILVGSAIFETPDYTQRTTLDHIQVGPSGPLNITSPSYGLISSLKGSGDLVPNPYYIPSNFVWGFSGAMYAFSRGPGSKYTHQYKGDCYLGYIDTTNNIVYDYNNPLMEGSFDLTWVYTDSATGQVSGTVTFEPSATIPVGWGYPLLFGRLGTHTVSTNDVGSFIISASDTFCSTGTCAGSGNPNNGGKRGISSTNLGLEVGLPIGIVFLVAMFGAGLFFWRRHRETEQEDGIFAVARKPEYGSALVVDDIIEETRGSRTLQAMIDIKDDYSDEGSDHESVRSESERSRSRSVSRSVSRSRSRSASRAKSYNEEDDDESDAGDSASRRSDSD